MIDFPRLNSGYNNGYNSGYNNNNNFNNRPGGGLLGGILNGGRPFNQPRVGDKSTKSSSTKGGINFGQ